MARIDRQEFFDKVKFELGAVRTITRPQALEIAEKYDLPKPNWLFNDLAVRAGRGEYHMPWSNGTAPKTVAPKEKKVAATRKAKAPKAADIQSNVPVNIEMKAPAASTTVTHPELTLVPEKLSGFVPFGHFGDLRSIIKSKKFYPAYVTGLSGNGKTVAVEQTCAAEKRECIRVNITIETDEDDLIGGFRLIDGQTVWQDGPVVVAMTRGAVLLLDEVDLGSNKLMCLQPVLEGHAIFLKKINRLVHPAPGFTVVATANTKGKGSDDGRFIGTNVMNEAFLERFPITFEWDYPPQKTEIKILTKVLEKSGLVSEDTNKFVDKLVTWADVTRKTFKEGGITEIISTRRLVHICEAFAIFGNKMKAIELCLNRFDEDTKLSFLDLYKKVDESVDAPPAANVDLDVASTEMPF